MQTILVTQKVHGIDACVALETVKKSVRVSIMQQLTKHGGRAAWKDIHRSIIPGMKITGVKDKFSLVKSLHLQNVGIDEEKKEIYYAR